MKRYLSWCAPVAAIACLGFVEAASAADLPRKAAVAPAATVAPGWTGFYIGANVGGGWGKRDVEFTPNDPATEFLFDGLGGVGGAPPDVSFNTSGALGGVQLGYNWQFNGNWLVGFETDFDWSGIKGSGAGAGAISPPPAPGGGGPVPLPIAATADEHIKWFGTVRARLGYLPTGNLLAYVTGGFAYGRVEHSGSYVNNSGTPLGLVDSPFSFHCAATAACFAGSSDSTAVGWTLGGGFEYAIRQNLTLKAEYLYVSLGSQSVTETATVLEVAGTVPASFNANFGRTAFNVARVGLNYRF